MCYTFIYLFPFVQLISCAYLLFCLHWHSYENGISLNDKKNKHSRSVDRFVIFFFLLTATIHIFIGWHKSVSMRFKLLILASLCSSSSIFIKWIFGIMFYSFHISAVSEFVPLSGCVSAHQCAIVLRVDACLPASRRFFLAQISMNVDITYCYNIIIIIMLCCML